MGKAQHELRRVSGAAEGAVGDCLPLRYVQERPWPLKAQQRHWSREQRRCTVSIFCCFRRGRDDRWLAVAL